MLYVHYNLYIIHEREMIALTHKDECCKSSSSRVMTHITHGKAKLVINKSLLLNSRRKTCLLLCFLCQLTCKKTIEESFFGF